MSARVLVVQHEEICPPGRLGTWLAAGGVDVDVVRPYVGERLPDVLDHDALVVLGGTMGANDDDRHSWLGPTKRLLRSAVLAGRPVLGVCLGHQLLAVACGGSVQANPNGSTIGLRPVDLAGPLGEIDPLFDGLPHRTLAVHWNDDVVTVLPPDAVVLASTSDGSPQVLRLGSRAWGIQFHPEADAAIVTVWADRTVAAGELSRAEADAHLVEITAADGAIGAWEDWARRFAAMIVS